MGEEPPAWKTFDVFCLAAPRAAKDDVANSRWVPTWGIFDGKPAANARLVVKGFPDSDLRQGLAETAGYVSFRSSRLRHISLSAVGKWEIRGVDVKHAPMLADASNW